MAYPLRFIGSSLKKKTHLPSLHSHQSPIVAISLEVVSPHWHGYYRSLAGLVEVIILLRFHRFIFPAISRRHCFEVNVLVQALKILLPLPQCSRSRKDCIYQLGLGTTQLVFTLYVNQFWTSGICYICYKKKPLL